MNQADTDTYEPERISTGIAGLDDILGGGLPKGHLYLIEGDSGAGKTTLGLQFVLEAVRQGERALWITLSETERELLSTARSHGWSMRGVEVCNLTVSEAELQPDNQYSFFSPADVELSETTQAVLEAVERVSPTRVVFDPFSDMRLLARDPLLYRRQVLALREYFAAREITVLLLQEATRHAQMDPQAEGLVHGFLTMQQNAPEYGGQRRRLRVHKLRGVSFRDGYHDFKITTGGLVVFPRLVAAEHSVSFPKETLSSNIPALDALLGGGIKRGSSCLFLGPAGVGKSCLATQYALATVSRGRKAALFLFDETLQAFVDRGDGLGMDVSGHLERGQLKVRQVDPAEMSPGEFTQLVRDAVEEEQVELVVVDSLNGYLNAMSEERFLTVHLHELLTYLSQSGMLTLFTVGQHGFLGSGAQPPVDVSYLSDTVVLLRYFEAYGAVHRAVSVVKKRNGPHDPYIREMRIGPTGLEVGEVLEQFQGVLSGQPQYSGEASRLTQGSSGDVGSAPS
jgi:circadian clock protein KaiC